MTEQPKELTKEEQAKLLRAQQEADLAGRMVELSIEVARSVALKLIETSPKSFILSNTSPAMVRDVAFRYGDEFAAEVFKRLKPEIAEEEEKSEKEEG